LVVRDLNARGTIVALAITTHDGDTYFISNDETQKELFRHINERVSVQGVVNVGNGEKIIAVNGYCLAGDEAREREENRLVGSDLAPLRLS
jgi:hypothetical protein